MKSGVLYAAIKDNPGSSRVELCKTMGCNDNGFSSAAQILLNNKKIIVTGTKKSFRYFPFNGVAETRPVVTTEKVTALPVPIFPPVPSTSISLDQIVREAIGKIVRETTDKIIAEETTRALVKIEQAMYSALSRLSRKLQPPDVPVNEEVQEIPRKPKVLIMGLLPSQEDVIKSEFSSLLNLRFWKDDTHVTLRDKARNVDYIVGLTKFISHSDEEIVKARPNYYRTPGGMTALQELLLSLSVES